MVNCEVWGCKRPVTNFGHCRLHYEWKVRKRYLPGCGIHGCWNPIDYPNLKLCEKHYRKMRRAEQSTGNPAVRPVKWSARDLEYARMLLEDGASYHEAARSSGIPRTTLRDKVPGQGWTMAEGGEFAAQMLNTPKLIALHREIGLLQNGEV